MIAKPHQPPRTNGEQCRLFRRVRCRPAPRLRAEACGQRGYQFAAHGGQVAGGRDRAAFAPRQRDDLDSDHHAIAVTADAALDEFRGPLEVELQAGQVAFGREPAELLAFQHHDGGHVGEIPFDERRERPGELPELEALQFGLDPDRADQVAVARTDPELGAGLPQAADHVCHVRGLDPGRGHRPVAKPDARPCLDELEADPRRLGPGLGLNEEDRVGREQPAEFHRGRAVAGSGSRQCELIHDAGDRLPFDEREPRLLRQLGREQVGEAPLGRRREDRDPAGRRRGPVGRCGQGRRGEQGRDKHGDEKSGSQSRGDHGKMGISTGHGYCLPCRHAPFDGAGRPILASRAGFSQRLSAGVPSETLDREPADGGHIQRRPVIRLRPACPAHPAVPQ